MKICIAMGPPLRGYNELGDWFGHEHLDEDAKK
jgi:hypothetical protein